MDGRKAVFIILGVCAALAAVIYLLVQYASGNDDLIRAPQQASELRADLPVSNR
ncbi:hypothetical protein [Paenibacillus tarimensis]|uniref:hypothetical protein n=1 Tax=Paenibacillus tarimensis TaxID=416012 RepID=UPI001F23468B|nr:hypothetical protein [Paenibacillus tarimensis]MCF2943144.1 hypothetical protein [Paenibacillus tarimensis]